VSEKVIEGRKPNSLAAMMAVHKAVELLPEGSSETQKSAAVTAALAAFEREDKLQRAKELYRRAETIFGGNKELHAHVAERRAGEAEIAATRTYLAPYMQPSETEPSPYWPERGRLTLYRGDIDMGDSYVRRAGYSSTALTVRINPKQPIQDEGSPFIIERATLEPTFYKGQPATRTREIAVDEQGVAITYHRLALLHGKQTTPPAGLSYNDIDNDEMFGRGFLEVGRPTTVNDLELALANTVDLAAQAIPCASRIQ
jgi:hypothetical protein